MCSYNLPSWYFTSTFATTTIKMTIISVSRFSFVWSKSHKTFVVSFLYLEQQQIDQMKCCKTNLRIFFFPFLQNVIRISKSVSSKWSLSETSTMNDFWAKFFDFGKIWLYLVCLSCWQQSMTNFNVVVSGLIIKRHVISIMLLI